MGCIPAVVLLAAVGISSIPRRELQLGATCILLGLSSTAVARVYHNAALRTDHRAAGAYLSHEAAEGDVVLVYAAFDHLPLNYYYAGNPHVSISPLWELDPAPTLRNPSKFHDRVQKLKNPRVWAALSHCQADPMAVVVESELATRYVPTREVHWSGITLLLFERNGNGVPLHGCR